MLKPINPLLFLFVVGSNNPFSTFRWGHWATKKSDSVQSRFQDPVQCLGMAPTSIVDGLEQASMPPTDMIDYDNYDMDWTVVQPILLTRLPPT